MRMNSYQTTLNKMADKVIALFVEGPTEIEFYKAVVRKARELMEAPFECKIEYYNMKGIGNYKNTALRKFDKLKSKNHDKDIYVFFCIDHDVFEFSKKPPFSKDELKKAFLSSGAKNVAFIVAVQSIEEWFLCDLEGVIDYLHLPATTKRPNGTGQDALKKLFIKANKIYSKGSKVDGLIEKIDIAKIMKKQCSSFKPLCKALSLDCKNICKTDS